MAKKLETETAGVETPSVSKFSKDQILKSRRYCEKRDVLSALLKDGEQYSRHGVERIIEEFMKGKVV